MVNAQPIKASRTALPYVHNPSIIASVTIYT